MVGDVIGSRSIENRDAFGDLLDDALTTANRACTNTIRADLTTVKGVDEIAGVLDSPRDVYTIVKAIHDAIYPHQLRLSVVQGAIDVNPQGTDVTTMDGPAFHHANETLEWVERQNSVFSFDAGHPTVDGLLSTNINLILTLREDWTEREFRTIRAREKTTSQTEAADHLGRSQQTVSDALQRAHWDRITQAEAVVDSVLTDYVEI